MSEIRCSAFECKDSGEKISVPIFNTNSMALRTEVATFGEGDSLVEVTLLLQSPGGFVFHFCADNTNYLVPLQQLGKVVIEHHERQKEKRNDG